MAALLRLLFWTEAASTYFILSPEEKLPSRFEPHSSPPGPPAHPHIVFLTPRQPMILPLEEGQPIDFRFRRHEIEGLRVRSWSGSEFEVQG